MKSAKTWGIAALHVVSVVGALAIGAGAGMTYAKLPQAPMDDAAKAAAEQKKAKAAETAKKDAENLAKSQDRAVERYKKEKGIKTVAAAPAKKK